MLGGYREKVEIKFKIAVPNADNNTLNPLKLEYDLEALKTRYKKVV